MISSSVFLQAIDASWSLFLDRDGVINKRIYDGYATKVEEFILLDKVKESFQIFRKIFGKIIVVTNQQGIGKGIMTEDDLVVVHDYMMKELDYAIDKVYYSPHLAKENHRMRKPNIGMALQAKQDFPGIDFTKAIMVGDSYTDILFGQNAGMKTVWVNEINSTRIQADIQVKSLYDFALLLEQQRKH
ncbi:MAG: HAD-IIIA family hydrolase [Bacteroidales bacterium]|jgi:histidinol-phosphate phosphatase family protein|nr:HAD-IIIA family hydrolase [Bacteroidales bacterium]